MVRVDAMIEQEIYFKLVTLTVARGTIYPNWVDVRGLLPRIALLDFPLTQLLLV